MDREEAARLDAEFAAKPNDCRACPDGCNSCTKDQDCECYEHGNLLPAEDDSDVIHPAPLAVYLTLVIATGQGANDIAEQTNTVRPRQAAKLRDVLDALHADPDALPATITKDGRPGLAVTTARTLEELETEYHERKCGCHGWPRSCELFGLLDGQIKPGAVAAIPSAWPVADVLRVATKLAYDYTAADLS